MIKLIQQSSCVDIAEFERGLDLRDYTCVVEAAQTSLHDFVSYTYLPNRDLVTKDNSQHVHHRGNWLYSVTSLIIVWMNTKQWMGRGYFIRYMTC